MGGHPPLGYRVHERKLVVDPAEAATVRMIFERFVRTGSATTLAKALAAEGVTTKRGRPADKGFLYKLLGNRVYVGEAVHKGAAYPDEHAAIVDRQVWDELFPAEQARIVQLLVARVEVDRLGITVQLRADGIGALARDLAPRTKQPARAA